MMVMVAVALEEIVFYFVCVDDGTPLSGFIMPDI